MAGPGIQSRQIDTPVGLIDIAPTVLDLAGLPPPPDLKGMSLLPYGVAAVPPQHPPVFIEMLKDPTHSERRVIIDWPWKLHFSITFDEYRLFDLSQDPQEERDVLARHPKVFARLQKRLRRWMSEDIVSIPPRRVDVKTKRNTEP
jgi:arylsulfatase A-like enzyme